MYKILLWFFILVHIIFLFFLLSLAGGYGGGTWGMGILLLGVLSLIHLLYFITTIIYVGKSKKYLNGINLLSIGLIPWIFFAGLASGNGDILIFSAPYPIALFWFRHQLIKNGAIEDRVSYKKIQRIVFYVLLILWLYILILKK